MQSDTITIKDFFNYNIAKNVLVSLLAIVVLTIGAFLYVFFAKYNSYKPKVSKINQNYTIDINFKQLNAFQENFFALKDPVYKTDPKLLYKIYDWPVISNWYDKARARIIEWKKSLTEETTIIKKRTVKENTLNKVLQKLRKLKEQSNAHK